MHQTLAGTLEHSKHVDVRTILIAKLQMLISNSRAMDSSQRLKATSEAYAGLKKPKRCSYEREW